MPWGVWLSLTLKVIKSLLQFLKLFCFMVSPHNSPFTSILLATPLSAFLPAAQAATAGWVLYPPSSHTSDPVNPQAGLKSPSLSPRRKTQWQVSSPSLRGRDNRPWIGRKAGMSQGQGRGTKYSCPLHPCTSPTKETETHTQKKALVTPPVWGWHLILGTEESSKHYRGSEKEIWERFCKIYLLLPLLWVLLWNKGMVQWIQLLLQCSTMSSHKSLVSAAHFELKRVSPSRAVWLRTLFYLTQIQNPRTKLLA